MRLSDRKYVADKGKQFVLTEKGKKECASYRHKTVGEPVDECSMVAVAHKVDNGYVIETAINGWTKLKGFEVVYYKNGYRLPAGNPQVFPVRKRAEIYKKHYESYPWFDNGLLIEEVEYEGVPLGESRTYNGKEVIDKEHYFGLDACEAGDYFSEDIINEFVDILHPTYMRCNCLQIGEPVSHLFDENGKLRATYSTFKRIANGIWEYCGDCFKRENIKRGNVEGRYDI